MTGIRDRNYKLITEAFGPNGSKVTVASSIKTIGDVAYPSINSITDGAGRVTTLTTNAKGYVETIKV